MAGGSALDMTDPLLGWPQLHIGMPGYPVTLRGMMPWPQRLRRFAGTAVCANLPFVASLGSTDSR